jgi:putative component of membrane protein insertase Oxa1/YidC/SpoIIIJ protein YidD
MAHHIYGRQALCGWLGSLALACAAGERDFQDEPWSVTAAAPVITTGPAVNPAAARTSEYISVSRTVCFGWLAFYQHVLHVVNVSHCPMLPSCSNYSIAAINKHGAFRGVILTADRLLHENDEQKYAPIIQRDGRSRYVDPVESNDFWWGTR